MKHKMSVQGSGLTYNPNDPITGEDTHTISGAITDIVFGEGTNAYGSPITKTELSISGLDLENDSTPLQRIYGEVNALISAFMHGENSAYPSQLAQVKAVLASYAQTFNGSAKADTYTGTLFNDIVRGNAGVDTVNGGAGNDKLCGGNGADIIKGGAGNDHLYGGAASDKLYGNAGADIFHFTAISDSRKNAFDMIYDFDGKGGDRIALSEIDANSSRGGNQAFTFIGSQDFHRKAGELHFDKVKGDTVVEGDLNGDGKADFVLHLDDAMSLKADYFIL
jgi:Ca2+-binding RTX toxin-like protein